MQDTLTRYLANVGDNSDQAALRPVLQALVDRYSTQTLVNAALVIKAGGGVLVKTGAIIYALCQGVLVTKGSATDMAALSGTVTAAKFNVFCFYVDAAGTLTSQMGTEGAALVNVVIPPPPVGKAMIGMVVINPTGTGNFVGGTTALDDGTVIPNAAYINTVGPIDSTVLI